MELRAESGETLDPLLAPYLESSGGSDPSAALLDTLFASAPIGMGFVDESFRYVRVNPRLAELDGVPVEAHLGRSVEEILPDLGPRFSACMTRVLESGEAVVGDEVAGTVPAYPTSPRCWSVSYYPVSTGGKITGVGLVVTDITEAKRNEESQAALLAAGRHLVATLDYRTMLTKVAAELLPLLGTFCVFEVPEDGGGRRRLVIRHADPEMDKHVRILHSRVELDDFAEPTYWEGVPAELALAAAGDPDGAAALELLDIASYVVVPLTAFDRNNQTTRRLGTMALASDQPITWWDKQRRELIDALAIRVSDALENVRLYAEKAHVAQKLQSLLLPKQLPQIEGLSVAGWWTPSTAGKGVSADFYDLFEADEGKWVAVMGDVCGKGPEAAAVAGLARHTLKTAAMIGGGPRDALITLNATVMREEVDQRFCTVAVSSLTRSGAGFDVTIACGGHPSPLLLTAAGEVSEIGVNGSLLGVFSDPELYESQCAMQPGDTLVMFTDGVIEARREGVTFGTHRLSELLGTLAGADVTAIADRIRTAVTDFSGSSDSLDDDMAILVLQVSPP